MKYPNEEIKIEVVEENKKEEKKQTPAVINHEFRDTKDGLGPFYEMVLFGAAIE